MFTPYYKIVEGPGKSGSIPEVAANWFTKNGNPDHASLSRFNPHRDISFGGTLLGYKGKNYWFADSSIVGRILKLIF
jgi:hypothetical protein